jgi:hypothetical protein
MTTLSLGDIVWLEVDSDQVVDHPVLDICSTAAMLKDKVVEWLNNNCQGRYELGHNQRTYELCFDSQDDATLFILRWL